MRRTKGKNRRPAIRSEYKAAQRSTQRKSPPARTRHEDFELVGSKQKQIWANSRDQQSNLSLIAWMIRKVARELSQFTFHAQTEHDDINTCLEKIIKWHGKRKNFDVAKRHSRDYFMYIFNLGKIGDGDSNMLFCRAAKVQGLEADRICKPEINIKDVPKNVIKDYTDKGILLSKSTGEAKRYCICSHDENGNLVYDKTVSADNLIMSGYFKRFAQTRGISPLSTAIESTAQLYEGWNWTLIKIKLHAMLGIAFKRREAVKSGFNNTKETVVDPDGNPIKSKYKINIDSGLYTVEMGHEDNVDTIESKTPNEELIPWSELMIKIILLALDIPYTSFDSRSSSYSAKIADMIDFDESNSIAVQQNKECLDEYTEWLLNYPTPKGKLKIYLDELNILLEKHDMTIDDLEYEWVKKRMGWLDKLKEVTADALAVAYGFTSRQEVVKSRSGGNFYKTLKAISKEEEAIAEGKVAGIMVGQSGQKTLLEIVKLLAEGSNDDEHSKSNTMDDN